MNSVNIIFTILTCHGFAGIFCQFIFREDPLGEFSYLSALFKMQTEQEELNEFFSFLSTRNLLLDTLLQQPSVQQHSDLYLNTRRRSS